MKRSIFNVLYIFALEPLLFEKNEIKYNQTDKHTLLYMTYVLFLSI